LQQKLSQVRGVGQVIVGGGSLPAVRVDLNPMALNKYGIGLEDVRRVLSSTNVNRPKGQLTDGARTWEIRTNDQLYKAMEYMPLVTMYRAGAALQLSDVAKIQDSVEDLRATGLFNGKTAVLVIIFRQPGANIIETVDHIREQMPQLEASIRRAIRLAVVGTGDASCRGSLARSQGACLHCHLDALLTHRGLPHDPDGGWRGGTPVARVRGDAVRGRRHLARAFADHDAHDVRRLLQAGK